MKLPTEPDTNTLVLFGQIQEVKEQIENLRKAIGGCTFLILLALGLGFWIVG